MIKVSYIFVIYDRPIYTGNGVSISALMEELNFMPISLCIRFRLAILIEYYTGTPQFITELFF